MLTFTSNLARMKHLLVFFFLIIGFTSFGQLTCTITPVDTITCFRDTCSGSDETCTVFRVNTTGSGNTTYQWYKNGDIMPGETNDFLLFPTIDVQDTAYYFCKVYRGPQTCTTDSGHLRIYPKLQIDKFVLDSTTIDCLENNCKGQIQLIVSGGVGPWSFEINNDTCRFPDYQVFSQRLIGVSSGDHNLKIIDSIGCSIKKQFFVPVKPVPKVSFLTSPKDTVYLTNPYLNVNIADTSVKNIVNWEWDFGDTTSVKDLNPAQHIYKYVRDYWVTLYYTAPNGCKGDTAKKMIIKTAQLTIPNLFTPDNDPAHLNETFKIVLQENETRNFGDAYISNELIVLDRWGRTVYSKQNYQSNEEVGDWDGGNLADGTYFYILKLHGYYGDEVYKGTVTILRDN